VVRTTCAGVSRRRVEAPMSRTNRRTAGADGRYIRRAALPRSHDLRRSRSLAAFHRERPSRCVRADRLALSRCRAAPDAAQRGTCQRMRKTLEPNRARIADRFRRLRLRTPGREPQRSRFSQACSMSAPGPESDLVVGRLRRQPLRSCPGRVDTRSLLPETRC
jgi:hypothetical protein